MRFPPPVVETRGIPATNGMTKSDAQREAENKWKRNNRMQLNVTFFLPDKNLFDYAKTQECTPSEYIRRLIREDMERNAE